jgi:hypothetical protein
VALQYLCCFVIDLTFGTLLVMFETSYSTVMLRLCMILGCGVMVMSGYVGWGEGAK